MCAGVRVGTARGGVRGEQQAAGARVVARRAAVGRARAGRRTGPGRRAAWPERGLRMACPGGGRGRVSRGQKGPGQARGRGGRKEREGEERRGKRKEKKMGKRRREKKEKGGERNKERKRERGASASAPIAAAVGHAWCRSRATRRPRAKQGWDSGRFGCRLGSSGYQEIRREMIQEGDRAQRQNKD